MHIEIPDGILPIWIWITGFVVLSLFLGIAVHYAKKEEEKMPLAALLAALSLLVMSVPLGLPIHINLMVLIGIIVGPWWSLIIAFLVNLILASLGHGGITIIGLNTLLLWSQAVLGFYLFSLIKRTVKEKSSLIKGISGGIVSFLSLMISFLLLGGLVFAINLNPEEVFTLNHDHNHHQEEDHHEDNDYDKHNHEEEDESHQEDKLEDQENNHKHTTTTDEYYDQEISLGAFFTLSLPIFLYAALIESIIIGAAISFIAKGKPEIL